MKYIYLIQHPDKPDWFKCGETHQPKDRLQAIQNANPSKVSYHSLFEARAANGDRECHKALDHLNRRGEWFEGDIEEAAEIVSSITWSHAESSMPDTIERIDNRTMRRKPATKDSDRSEYGSVSFLDVVCPA